MFHVFITRQSGTENWHSDSHLKWQVHTAHTLIFSGILNSPGNQCPAWSYSKSHSLLRRPHLSKMCGRGLWSWSASMADCRLPTTHCNLTCLTTFSVHIASTPPSSATTQGWWPWLQGRERGGVSTPCLLPREVSLQPRVLWRWANDWWDAWHPTLTACHMPHCDTVISCKYASPEDQVCHGLIPHSTQLNAGH